MRLLSFPPPILVFAFWKRASEALHGATWFGIVALVLFISTRHSGAYDHGILDRVWYVAYPRVYLFGALFGFLIVCTFLDDQMKTERYSSDLKVMVMGLDAAGLQRLTWKYQQRVLFWNPLCWPFRAAYRVIAFLIWAFTPHPGFRPIDVGK